MSQTRSDPAASTTPRARIARGSMVAATVVASTVMLLSVAGSWAQVPPRAFQLMEATIPELQAALAAGSVTSRDLVATYPARNDAYDQKGPALNAISAINGQAVAEADALDAERPSAAPCGRRS